MTIVPGSFRGLAFGPGSRYAVTSIEGLDDLPAVVSSDEPLPGEHGARSTPDLVQPRTVTVGLGLRGLTPAHLADLVDDLRAATAPGAVPEVLELQGWTLYAKPRRRSIPYDATRLGRLSFASVEFYCADPRLYGPENRVEVAVETAAVGYAYPLVYPLVYGASGTSPAVLANGGNTDTGLLILIPGPITNPRAERLDNGDRLGFTLEVPAGQTLILDTANKRATLAGANVRGQMSPGSKWLRLPKGNTSLGLFGSTPTTARATITWRAATL